MKKILSVLLIALMLMGCSTNTGGVKPEEDTNNGNESGGVVERVPYSMEEIADLVRVSAKEHNHEVVSDSYVINGVENNIDEFKETTFYYFADEMGWEEVENYLFFQAMSEDLEYTEVFAFELKEDAVVFPVDMETNLEFYLGLLREQANEYDDMKAWLDSCDNGVIFHVDNMMFLLLTQDYKQLREQIEGGK